MIEEAVDLYIQEQTAGKREVGHLLTMRGTWNREEARKFQKKLSEIRIDWKVA